ncbi:hypothetical protein BE61_79450 [Bradyrhizobium elkanii USDA 61]|nr:hypothetical protein BE61_79450 [Bradyrhizobium elkanii USDA 61]
MGHAYAVDVSDEIVAHDTDLALFADLAGNRAQHRVPPRRAKSRADDLGGQHNQLIAYHVALRSKRFLKEAAFFQISDKPMRGWNG